MLKIRALNEPDSEGESDGEAVQVETKEAQEANLFNLYNAALAHLVDGRTKAAEANLREILDSAFFQQDTSELIAKTLRYNVHKNLGECHLVQEEMKEAQEQMLAATDIDSTDVTMWFKIAGTAVKTGNLYLCRSALEQGLLCSPNHWPCLDNLITVTFKLGDNLSCLSYCGSALDREPTHSKAILYKSKVYNDMPFLREVCNDTAFIPLPTEPETYSTPIKAAEPRPPIDLQLGSLTWASLAAALLKLYSKCEANNQVVNPVDTRAAVLRCRENLRREEDNKLRVSVQNLVDEMIDIIEDAEDVECYIEDLLDNLLCDMFHVEPRKKSERVVDAILEDLLSTAIAEADHPKGGGPPPRKKTVIIEAKVRERKKASILDQIPEELIEKRRSSRKARGVLEASVVSSDASNDVAAIQTPKALLESFLPKSLRMSSKDFAAKLMINATVQTNKSTSAKSGPEARMPPASGRAEAKKRLFGGGQENKREEAGSGWFSPEEEAETVATFLDEMGDYAVWDILRYYLDYMYKLSPERIWPTDLTEWVGRVYELWRLHITDPLNLEDPQEKFTQEFLRYYLIGNEAITGCLLEREKEEPDTEEDEEPGGREPVVPEHLQKLLYQDQLELNFLQPHLPPHQSARVHALRFHYASLMGEEEEMVWESDQLKYLYETPLPPRPDMSSVNGDGLLLLPPTAQRLVVVSPIPQYKIPTRKDLDDQIGNMNKVKELTELNQYYDSQRYGEIVELLTDRLEANNFTPSKDAARMPNRETQVDIFMESLYYVGEFVRSMKWCISALGSYVLKAITDPETDEPVKLNAHDWTVIDSYLSTLESCVDATPKKDYADLNLESASRLAAILVKLITLQIDDPVSAELAFTSSLPWILFHKLLAWAENDEKASKKPAVAGLDQHPLIDLELTMPASLSLLCSAHDYLGQKSCCTLEQGRLLNYIVDVFVPLLGQTPLPTYTDQLKTNLDQAIYCLFAHPSKKSRARHLADHSVSQVALKWDRAKVLYQYFKPTKIPEHDDLKALSISTDTENLLKRVVALVPDAVELEKRKTAAFKVVTALATKIKVKDYDRLPEGLKDLFYLLADYNFKSNTDIDKVIEFYCLDLSFNPKRYDSWAALALTQASRLDRKLNSCRKLVPASMLASMRAVKNCFTRCLKLDETNSNLWIEFGNFSYNIHAYISRTLQNTEDLSIEMFEVLEKQKEEFLNLALKNYEKTLAIFEKDGIAENDIDERWLIYYMIGKIKEKKNTPLLDCLKIYETAMDSLRKNNVVLPRKVNYNSPQASALECLELYYRVHASILKYLVKYENRESSVDKSTRQQLYDQMKRFQLEPMYNTNAPEDRTGRFSRKRKVSSPEPNAVGGEEPPDKLAKTTACSTTIMRDVIEVMDGLMDEVEYATDEAKFSVDSLIRLALLGLEDVAYHFFHHFKAIYRLAHYYHTSEKHKDPVRVQKLLLASDKDPGVVCPGLFFGRKPNQVFNEVWRIPITEIDRPGSFAAHCSKSLMLLLDVLKATSDIATLGEISLQLKKPPSEENKFLHENDRLEVGAMCVTHFINSMKDVARSTSVEKERVKPTIILEMHKLYQRFQKQWPGKEKELIIHIKDLYLRIHNRPTSDKVTAEEVLRFCTQENSKQRIIQRGGAVNSSLLQSGNSNVNRSVPENSSSATSTPVKQTSDGPTSAVITPASQDYIQKRAHISAYVHRISTYLEYSALSLAANIDLAAMTGLILVDQQRDLMALANSISTMTPQQMVQISITSNELTNVLKFAQNLELADVIGPLNLLLDRQIEYEKQCVRQVMASKKKPPFPKTGAAAVVGVGNNPMPTVVRTKLGRPFKTKPAVGTAGAPRMARPVKPAKSTAKLATPGPRPAAAAAAGNNLTISGSLASSIVQNLAKKETTAQAIQQIFAATNLSITKPPASSPSTLTTAKVAALQSANNVPGRSSPVTASPTSGSSLFRPFGQQQQSPAESKVTATGGKDPVASIDISKKFPGITLSTVQPSGKSSYSPSPSHIQVKQFANVKAPNNTNVTSSVAATGSSSSGVARAGVAGNSGVRTQFGAKTGAKAQMAANSAAKQPVLTKQPGSGKAQMPGAGGVKSQTGGGVRQGGVTKAKTVAGPNSANKDLLAFKNKLLKNLPNQGRNSPFPTTSTTTTTTTPGPSPLAKQQAPLVKKPAVNSPKPDSDEPELICID